MSSISKKTDPMDSALDVYRMFAKAIDAYNPHPHRRRAPAPGTTSPQGARASRSRRRIRCSYEADSSHHKDLNHGDFVVANRGKNGVIDFQEE